MSTRYQVSIVVDFIFEKYDIISAINNAPDVRFSKKKKSNKRERECSQFQKMIVRLEAPI